MTAIQYISQLGQAAAGSAAATDLVPVTQGSTGPTTGTTRKMYLAESARGVIGAVNVKAFGAKGDGVTNDRVAIQAALNAVPTGGSVVLPPGTYMTDGTLFIKANTLLTGAGAVSIIKAMATWPVPSATYPILMNANYSASVITDSDIFIENLALDYGAFGPIGVPGGGKHALEMRKVQTVKVSNLLFQCRGAENATAFIGCDDTVITACSAYDFVNCAYDHWDRPTNAILSSSFASSAASNQFINFNPEDSAGFGTGYSAVNFCVTNNIFVCTGPNPSGAQVEPLGTGSFVKDVLICANVFNNITLAMRGAVRGASISGNTFFQPKASASAMFSYPNLGGVPDGISFVGNNIVDPQTGLVNLAVIRLEALNSCIVGNTISGTTYGTVPGISTGSYAVAVSGNNISNGVVNLPIAVSGNNPIIMPNNVALAWRDTAGAQAQMFVQADDNLVWVGTAADTSARTIASIYQRSNTSSLRFAVPIKTLSPFDFADPVQLAATGTVIGTAAIVTTNVTEVTSCTAGVNDGVALGALLGRPQVIVNSTAATLKVYPNNSGSAQIDNGGANIPVTIAAGKSKTFVLCSTNNFRTIAST